MSETMVRDEALDKIWSLIKEARSALLVTVTKDGSLDSRPMGCVQRAFDGKLWFLAFASSPKITEIEHNSHVLVAYSRPSEFEYVSLSGRARIIEDKRKVQELWSEALRVWFPAGPDDPELTVISVDVDEARYWTRAAPVVTYATAYIKARLLGRRATADEVAEVGSVRL